MIVEKGNNLCTSKLRLLYTINIVILRYKKHQKTDIFCLLGYCIMGGGGWWISGGGGGPPPLDGSGRCPGFQFPGFRSESKYGSKTGTYPTSEAEKLALADLDERKKQVRSDWSTSGQKAFKIEVFWPMFGPFRPDLHQADFGTQA